MIRACCIVAGMGLSLACAAQDATTVEKRSFAFSDGIHPTFAVTFHGAGTRTIEDHWRGVLKRVSHKVGGKKEIIGMTALIPEISHDTMRVLVKGDQPRGSGSTTLHVAFLTTMGWLGPGSDSAMVRGAREFVRREALALRIRLADEAVLQADRTLSRMRGELAMLEREQGRMEMQRSKARQRDSTSVADQARLAQEIEVARTHAEERRAALREAHTEEGVKELKAREKHHDKLTSRHAAAQRAMEQARKRDAGLKDGLRRNAEAQAAKRQEIERQRARTEELREAREAIH
ncbi:MAG: hypothetical protein KIT10_12425 [Flavobacteriales bacterium]|nr:hypothetical protein [Flavobacteriales bacterium]